MVPFYDSHRAEIAVLFEDPDWRLTEGEKMVVLRHRIVAEERSARGARAVRR